MNTYLSEHFSFSEMTRSETAKRLGITNQPNEVETRNLKVLCSQVLEPARKKFGKPLHISSGFRCKQLNRAVGGVAASYHVQGRAADINRLTFDDALTLANILNEQLLTDVVLVEVSRAALWVHVQWSPNPRHILNKHYNA